MISCLLCFRKISEENVTRFDKAMEDFLSICNQIELHLVMIIMIIM